MGTTMAFFSVYNTGFTTDDLRNKLKRLSGNDTSKTDEFDKMLEQFMSPEMVKFGRDRVSASRSIFASMCGQEPIANRSVIAYADGAKWLPLFEEQLCEGNNASDSDMKIMIKRTIKWSFQKYYSNIATKTCIRN